MKKDFTYIDLFAGIGGFHCAMDIISDGKAKCIFASEIDEHARKVYKDNFGIEPLGDIRKIDPSKYPAPDIVCGGFPCQTFSKAGKQDGFKDPRGTLFREIIRLIEFYEFEQRPKLLLLENVRNLISHDNGDTWKTIKHEIENVGYNIISSPLVAAPKDFGIPQLRDRAIIFAVRKDLFKGKITINLTKAPRNSLSIETILEKKDLIGSKQLNESQIYCLDCWNDFIKHINRKIIGFPVWSDEFGKNYSVSEYPRWKQEFILNNRKLYSENKQFIDAWMKKWAIRKTMTATNRKFEWQVGGEIDDVYNGIIQFRTSGIRVKRPTESPALVAMVHLPIIGKYKRTLSIREGANLQSFPKNFRFDEKPSLAFKQLGNAVNVKVISESFNLFKKAIRLKFEGEKYEHNN